MPDRSLTLYGITGTNGKTTTAYVLASVFSAAFGADKVGMLTTVAFRIGRRQTRNETKLTTLPSSLVYRWLREMKQSGVTHVAVEMTSHALDQNRLAGLRLDGGIILNIQREHLDYHQDMQTYAAAKSKIIPYLKPSAPFVYKADDGRVRAIIETTAKDRELTLLPFTSQAASGISTPLAGSINKENVLAASLLARSAGIAADVIQKGISSLKSVPGRMEWVDSGRGFRILIDYAVTPDALEHLYRYAKENTAGKIFALLGAAGLRDRGKRPEMARVVAKYADELVLTREDPWTEPEEQIFSDLEAGLREMSVPWQRIVDRREALRYLLGKAASGDVVVVTGKGAEVGMGVGTKIIPWNDREEIEKILSFLSSGGSAATEGS